MSVAVQNEREVPIKQCSAGVPSRSPMPSTEVFMVRFGEASASSGCFGTDRFRNANDQIFLWR